METLNLQLIPVREISAPFEAPEFRLVLQNPNRADIRIRSDWYAGARIGIFHPGGERTVLMPFGEQGVARAGLDDEILSRSERERRFTLRGAASPGLYVLAAKLASDVPMHASCKWFLEALQPLGLAVSRAGGEPGEWAWVLSPGMKQGTLFQIPIGLCDVAEPAPVRAGTPERTAVVDAAAHGLVACALPESGGRREHQRVAWLSGSNVLHVGVTAVLFDGVEVSLPGPPRRILAPVLVKEDGACDVFVLSGDGLAIWVYRGPPAVPRKVPPSPSLGPMDEGQPEDLDTLPPDEDEEDSEPAFLPGADVPAPELTSTIPLTSAATSGAVTGGPGYSTLALASDAGEAIELLHQVLDGSLQPAARNHARIERASLIAGCDPWIAVDDRGITRVAVLFHEREAESHAVGMAKLAFDRDAEPVWIEGVGRQRAGLLRVAPVDGALAGTGADGWPLAWCVRTADGELVGSLGGAAHSRRITDRAVRPMVLLTTPERMAVAMESDDGIRFVGV